MPTLTRWFVKTSFIYLALALIAGLLVEIQSALNLGLLLRAIAEPIHST